MNIFEQAQAIKEAKEASARKGSVSSSPDTLTIPYFKGIVRKGDKYSTKGTIKKKACEFQVKPLTGAFLISYFSCLAYCLCKAEKQPCTIFVVQALLQHEGFSLDDYAQGKTKGSTRIAGHLKAIAEQRNLPLSVDAKTGEIKGLSDEIAKSVLSSL